MITSNSSSMTQHTCSKCGAPYVVRTINGHKTMQFTCDCPAWCVNCRRDGHPSANTCKGCELYLGAQAQGFDRILPITVGKYFIYLNPQDKTWSEATIVNDLALVPLDAQYGVGKTVEDAINLLYQSSTFALVHSVTVYRSIEQSLHKDICEKVSRALSNPMKEDNKRWNPYYKEQERIKREQEQKDEKRRPCDIAEEIRRIWKPVYYGAVPYLDAMACLPDMTTNYGMDSAKSIVLYFLANASQFKGERAREIKKELKALAK